MKFTLVPPKNVPLRDTVTWVNTGDRDLAGATPLVVDNYALGINVGWADGDYSDRRAKTLENIREIRNQMQDCGSEDEREAFQMALKCEVQQLERLNKEQEKAQREGEDPTKGHSVVYNAGVLLP